MTKKHPDVFEKDELRKVQASGRVATYHFQTGHPERALPLLQQTTAFYRKARDKRGLAADMETLFEVYRYLGQGAEAADAAREWAWALDHSGGRARADRIWKLADVVQRGEPLNRVVVDYRGATHELDALPHLVTVSLRFSFCRNRTELAQCTDRAQQGRELAREGRFEEALARFTEAGRLDAHSPEPRYEGAETLLHLQRASEAVAWYDEAEALAPGWYACRARRWLAAGIAAGRIPHTAFLLLRELERPNPGAEEQAELARRALREAPGVPEFPWHLGRQLVAFGREEEAVKVFAEALTWAEEPDVCSRLRVEFAALLPASAERDQRLHEAMTPGGSLIAAAMAGVMLRTGPSQRPDPRRADSTVVVHKFHLTREELDLLAKYQLDDQSVPQEHRHLEQHLSLCEECSGEYRWRIPPQWVR